MLFENEKKSYVLTGIFNTIIGYFIGVFVYQIFIQDLNIVLIGLLANVLSISISFCNYKVFVFKTKGNWLKEYLKSYLVYGGTALVGICLLWLFIEQLNLNIWLGQLIIIGLTTIVSYIGHQQFTFAKSINHSNKQP